MENKQSKRRWKIPVLLVSAICILLASSFVFHTTAEAAVLSYSLQGASFGNPVLDDGSLSSNGLDRALIDNYSVTTQNQYVGVTQESFSLTGSVYSAVSNFDVGVWDCSSVYAAYLTSSGGKDVRLYTANGVLEKTYSVSPKFFFSDRFLSGSSVYDLEGNLLGTFPIGSNIVSAFFRDGKYILFYSINGIFSIFVFDSGFGQLYSVTVYNGSSSALSCCYCTDEYAVWFSSGTVFVFDLESFTVSSKDNKSGRFQGYMTQLGDRLYLLYSKVFYVFDLELNFLFSYNASNLSAIASSSAKLNNFCGTFIIDNSSPSYTIASIPNQYYANFSAHFVDSFTPSKWINFSCKPSSDGSVVGGDAVGIKLDYALSDQYLSSVNTYGVRVSGCTILASLDDLSTGTGYYGLPPLVVKVNGSVVPRITKEYESVEKVGDVYLYAFSAFCDFQGSTRINSLEIIMNCFVPEQLSRHSFSLPVSDVELYLEPAGGGGGGESSDTSSGGTSSGGGGGGTSSDTSSDGDVSVPDEGGMLTFYKLSHYNQTQFIESVPSDGITKVSVFMGGFEAYYYQNHNTYGAVTGYITINYANAPTKVILLDFAVQGWSHYPSLTSVHYPTFTGTLIEVDHLFGDAIYLTDLVPYGQARVLDYDGFTYALVNYLAPDAYISVTQDSLNKIKVNVNQGGTGSYKLFPGKIARYKMSGFDGSTSWENFEFDDTVFLSRSDFQSDGYDSLMLQIYTGEFPPYDPDFESQLRDESLKREELENAANSAFADYSYDPQDKADFLEAAMSFDSALNNTGAHELFRFIDKMWNSTPVLGLFIAVTCSCAIIFFFVRKL